MREKHIQVVFVGPVLLSLPKSLACPSAQPGRAHLLLLWLPFLQIVQLAKRKTTSQATAYSTSIKISIQYTWIVTVVFLGNTYSCLPENAADSASVSREMQSLCPASIPGDSLRR